MQDPVCMAVVDAANQLERELLYHCWVQTFVARTYTVHVLLQVQIEELKNKVQFLFLVNDVVQSAERSVGQGLEW